MKTKLLRKFNGFLSDCGPDAWINADDYQNKMKEYLENKDFSKSLELVEKLAKDYNVKSGADLIFLLKTIASSPLSTEKSEKVELMPNEIEALTYKFYDGAPKKQVIRIRDGIDFEEAKRVSEIIIGNKLTQDSEVVFPFIVSNNITKNGRIVQKINSKSPYGLLSIFVKGDYSKGMFWVNFIDNPKKMDYYKSEKYTEYLHTYIFQSEEDNSENNMEYTLLSKHPLPIMEDIIIKGMKIPINDKIKIGSSAVINKGVEVIYVIEYEKMINDISEDKFKQLISKYKNNFDLLYSDYFGKFRHPRVFENFLLGWLFSSECSYGPINAYKPNLGIIGPTRGGKSRILDCLTRVFREQKESENSTIKSFVPNFGGNRADAGRFLKTKRFLIAEEFLSKLNNSDGSVFESLKSLLVHDNINAGSGKFEGQVVQGRPTSTMVFASNFLKPRINNIVQLASKVDPSILSRFIIYVETKEHFDYIQERKEKMSKEKYRSDTEFLPSFSFSKIEVYDYLLKKKVDFNGFDEFDIIELGKKYLPDDDNLREIYNGYNEHLVRLIDGITKKNYIIEGRTGDIKVTQTDFDEAKEIWSFIINSWTGDTSKLPLKQKISLLNRKQRIIYESIKDKPGITKKELDYILEETSSKVIDELCKLNLIRRSSLSNSSYELISDIDLVNGGLNGK